MKKTNIISKEDFENILSVLNSYPDGIVVLDYSKVVIYANTAAEFLFCFGSSLLIGNKLEVNFRLGETIEFECNNKVLEIKASSTIWNYKNVILLSIRDITARKKREKTLLESEERYALAMQGSNDGLWDWNLIKNEIYFSERWKSIIGYDVDEISSSPEEWFSRIHPEDISMVKSAISAHMEGITHLLEIEYRILHKDGTYRWILCRGVAVFDKNGKVCRLTGSQTDITERKETEKNLEKALIDLKFALASEKVLLDELDKRNKELVELSITDGLTGLYNHRFLQERLEFEFKRIKRYGGNLSCIMIDIDHFKQLNDNFGHQCGDFVLREIAQILRKSSREVDICGRYGGEEFLILTSVCLEDTLQFATKLHTAIENYIFKFEDKSIHVTVSIGIADYRPDIKNRHEFIERADMALYQAKEDGRNLIRVWKEKPDDTSLSINHIGILELKKQFVDLSRQMRATYLEYTNALVKAVDAKDPYTKQHSQNVSVISVEIAKSLNLNENDIEVIKYAALLHDIGKIAVSEAILTKNDRLTKDEYEILKKHPIIGANILKDIKFLEKEIPIILHHHERFDGNGYPYGLKGREIPLGARIIAIADAFDAMISGRGYKKSISLEDTLKEIKMASGTQFAPEIVNKFIEVLEKNPTLIKNIYEST
jgi:diguanylate cyclase (GGDEF)-like protein/PAS domain S-box-containing protein/putative nucleotidyltransferase with HDIG domain